MQTSSGFNINLGVVIDKNLKTSALQSIEKLRVEAEKKGSISLKVKMDANGVKQQIETITTASGDYAKVISVLDKNNKILKQSIVEVGNSATKASKQIEKAKQAEAKATEQSAKKQETALDKVIAKQQQLSTELKTLTSNATYQGMTREEMAGGWIKSIRTYVDEAKNLIETTSLFNPWTGQHTEFVSNVLTQEQQVKRAFEKSQQEAKAYEQEQARLNQQLEREAKAQKKATQYTEKHATAERTLGNETKKNTNIFKNFTDTFLKMAKFNTINLIYDSLIDSMRSVIEVTNEFDKAMTEFKKVTDTSNLSLQEYVNTLGELGDKVGRSQTQLLEASTEFSKSGYSPEDSARLAQIAS